MSDNATAHNARVYEAEVRRTIPFHGELLTQAIDWALAAVPSPARWLDTGCGPGRLVAVARAKAPWTKFYLADPAPAMLDLARGNNSDLPPEHFFEVPSDALPDIGPVNVITAVQCHHYSDPEGRSRAVRRCLSLLSPGGALVVFENVRAESDEGHALQRTRQASFLRAQGRSDAEVATHLAREGTKFFPIRPSEHIALLSTAGFRTVEMIWRSYGQAGFLAIAP